MGFKGGVLGTRRWLIVSIVALALGSAGCNNYVGPNITNGPSNNSINIALLPTGTIPVDVGASVTIQAFVIGDSTNQGVKWSLSGPGTLTNASTTQVTYTAPASLAVASASVTATEIADTTQTSTAIINIKALPTFVTTTLPGATVGTAYSSTVSVTGGAAPFTWSVSAGALPPGLSFSVQSLNSIEVSGNPATAGTFNFTFKATDSTSGTTTQQFSITVAAAVGGMARRANLSGTNGSDAAPTALPHDSTNDALLSGQYALSFDGFDSTGAVSASGTLSLDGAGNVTNGSMDRVDASGVHSTVDFSGTYAVGVNHLGAMILSFADGSSTTYAVAAASDGSARFIEFDDTTGLGTRGSGQLTSAEPIIQPAATPSLNGIFSGATTAPVDASTIDVVASLSFDGNGNASAIFATSGPNGLDILETQTGTYTVNGSSVTLNGITLNGAALEVTVLSPEKISISVQNAPSSPAIVAKN